jgi:K+-sensing histidine kinase KdpD
MNKQPSPSQQHAISLIKAYLSPILSLVLPPGALLIQWSLWPLIAPHGWFQFFPAVFASSWIGGRAAGIRATGISVALVWWSFLPHEHSLLKYNSQYILPLVLFTAMGIVISLSHERLRRNATMNCSIRPRTACLSRKWMDVALMQTTQPAACLAGHARRSSIKLLSTWFQQRTWSG